ncbi:hypothetical protein ACHWQZ_G010898 [Mnemiopsis leidyi]
MLHLLLAVFFGAALANDGWITVERNVFINYDLENSPLQIKTDSVVGSDEQVYVSFRTAQNYDAGDVSLFFTSPPQYYLGYCTSLTINFPTVLPTETNRVWTITLSRVSGEIRVVITCNTVEVLNVVLSSTTCSYSGWSTFWNRDVEKIYFPSLDTASDYYRAAPECTGLKTEWTSTIETTTKFPVDPGTVVTVTCLDSDAVNGGSSEVTCTGEKTFTFSIEPSCSAPICTGLKTEWTGTIETTTKFPVDPGTVVTVTCLDSDAVNVGSSEVTCTKETDYTFSIEPSCSTPVLLFAQMAFAQL